MVHHGALGAIKKHLERTGWSASQVDLYEIDEAFAVVTMAAMKEHGLPLDKVNVHGGACALGHPIGASGRSRLSRSSSVSARREIRPAGACETGGRPMAGA